MHRQAINTKWIGPTDTKGSRVKAFAPAGSITVNWDHSLDQDGNHDAAALALVKKLDWDGTWARGGNADHSGNVYVWLGYVEPEKILATTFNAGPRK